MKIPSEVFSVAQHYQEATEIPFMILDVDQKKLYTNSGELVDYIDSTCMEEHVKAAFLSERFGGSYSYFCFTSLLFWVSPVIKDSKMRYAIVAGPVLVIDRDEAAEEISNKNSVDQKVIHEWLESVPVIQITRVHHLSEVLRMCAGWASGYTEHQMEERREELNTQSRVAEYIQHIKEDPKGADDLQHIYPIAKEQELQDAIRWGDIQEAKKMLNELLGHIYFSKGATLERIKFRVIELLSLLSRAAVLGGAPQEQVMAINLRGQKEVSFYSSIEGLSLWLTRLLNEYTKLVFSSKETLYGPEILTALRFMRQYYDKQITLDDVASVAQLSSPYFSRIFKERVGISFNTYLNELRIEQAHRLLLQTSLPLIEIAGLVGFTDQSYFTKVFKRVVGSAPGQFRRRANHYPIDRQEIHSKS